MWSWQGGIFDSGNWEQDRSRLHHDAFHHRFYHFLASSEEVFAKSLENGNQRLPESVEQAFANWPDISLQMHGLFARAPREAISDPQALLARMALDAVEKTGFPNDVANEIRAKAKEVIAACATRDKNKIRRAMSESKRLLKQLDTLVASMHPHPSPLPRGEGAGRRGERDIRKEGMSKWEAMSLVQNLLDVCRRFDIALSGIPARLRSDTDGE